MSKLYASNVTIGDDTIWIKDKKTEDTVNVVLDYGADNTGASDSTVAIQKALDSGKPYIYFPDGTYKISSMLEVSSNSYLFSNNALISQESITAIGVLINKSDGTKGGWTATENVTIDGLSFTIHSKWGCVVFGHSKNIKIVNCKFYNDCTSERMKGHLIEINGSFNVLIEDCYFTNVKSLNEMIQLDVPTSSSAFPWFEPYDDTSCQNIKINHCTFYRSSLPDKDILDDSYIDSAIGNHNGANNARIIDVSVTNCYIYGIKTGIAFRFLMNGFISGNTIRNCQTGITTRGSEGIKYQNVIITDNIVIGNKADFTEEISDSRFCRGINIQNPDDTNKAVTIKNNTIRDFAGMGMLVSADNSLITGNYVLANGKHGMYIGRSSFKTTYTNNVAQGNRSLVNEPNNYFDMFIAQTTANTNANAGANYVFGNFCEYLGMNIIDTGLSRTFVFNNKYQYITYPDNNNIDVFGNVVTGTGEYVYDLIQGTIPTKLGSWELLASEEMTASHDGVWFTHAEATIPEGYTGAITLRLMYGTQEIARQTEQCYGKQVSVAVASVGFLKKGAKISLYANIDATMESIGKIRFRSACLPTQTAVPNNF